MDSCTKQMETPGHFEQFNFQKRGIRVEDLLNKFRSESKFDTMSKSKKVTKKQEQEYDEIIQEENVTSNDLGNTLGESGEIQLVKIPFTEHSPSEKDSVNEKSE